MAAATSAMSGKAAKLLSGKSAKMLSKFECMDSMCAAMSAVPAKSAWMLSTFECTDSTPAIMRDKMSDKLAEMLSRRNGATPLCMFGAVGNTSCRQLGQEF